MESYFFGTQCIAVESGNGCGNRPTCMLLCFVVPRPARQSWVLVYIVHVDYSGLSAIIIKILLLPPAGGISIRRHCWLVVRSFVGVFVSVFVT